MKQHQQSSNGKLEIWRKIEILKRLNQNHPKLVHNEP